LVWFDLIGSFGFSMIIAPIQSLSWLVDKREFCRDERKALPNHELMSDQS
jgi:hypothetical protein